jgi:hypothetical protein
MCCSGAGLGRAKRLSENQIMYGLSIVIYGVTQRSAVSETLYSRSDWCQRRFTESRILIGNLQCSEKYTTSPPFVQPAGIGRMKGIARGGVVPLRWWSGL